MILRGESNENEVGGLADLLEPPSSATRGIDIAFADTVHVRDLSAFDTGEDGPPPSGPVIVNDPDQGTQWMTPLAFPLPPAAETVSLSTKLRVLSARVRHGFRGSIEEAQDAWSQTSAAPSFVERLRALWSFWQWERTDLVRAAVIGGAVFLVVATMGALVLATGDSSGEGRFGVGAAASGEVRAPRTVDQHTGRAFQASPSVRARR